MISSRQLMLIVALSRLSVIFVFMPVVTGADALQDAWLAVILATAAGALFGAAAAHLATRFPDDTFGTFARDVLGTIPGVVAATALGLFFYSLAIMRTRQLAFLLIATQLQQAPSWVFATTMILGAIYGTYLGPDAFGRAAEILFTLIVASILVGVVLLPIAVPMDVRLLQPVLARGLEPILEASINPAFWFASSAATVLFLAKYTVDVKQAVKSVVKGTLISGSTLLLMAVLATVSLGPQEARNQISPLVSMARIIYIRDAIERLDLLALNIWVLGLQFDAALFLLAATVILADAWAVKSNSMLLLLGAGGLVVASLKVFDLFMIRQALTPEITGIVTLVLHVGIIGLTLVIAIVRGKGYQRDDE